MSNQPARYIRAADADSSFADSRQDAAHQARFITYTGRYDRMRRRLVRVLQEAGEPLSIDRAVQELMVRGVTRHDNPCAAGFDDPDFLPEMVQEATTPARKLPVIDVTFPEIEKFDRLPDPRADGPSAFVS